MKSQPKIGTKMAEVIDQLARKPESGIPLRGDLKGCYKYRVGSYRLIYEIKKSVLTVIVIDIGHRKDIYR